MKLWTIILATFLISSCIKDRLQMNEFNGEWEYNTIEITQYDTLGKESGSTNIETYGTLKLRSKDSVFAATKVIEIGYSGYFSVNKIGDDAVLYFRKSLTGSAGGKKKVTVTKKTKSKMHLTFYTIDGKGRLLEKKTYQFTYKQKVKTSGALNDPSDVGGFKYTDKNGTQVIIPYLQHTYYFEDGIYKLKIEFFNDEPIPEYKYLQFIISGNASAISPGNYPSSYTSTDSNTLNSVYFYDGGNSPGNYHFGSAFDVNLVLTEISASVSGLEVKGTIDDMQFISAPLSVGSTSMGAVEIDI